MEYEEVLEEVEQQIAEIGEFGSDCLLVIVKPDEASEEDFKRACEECGLTDEI